MTALKDRDYFTDMAVLREPYDYFEAMREGGPIRQMADRDLLLVTGFQEAHDILVNSEDFSSMIATDPLSPLPFTPQGDDITAQIEANRPSDPMKELMVNYDGEKHRSARSILHGLFMPRRLKANEDYMRALGTKMVSEVAAKGGCELISEIATPFVTLVIADLLGVPDDDREKFRQIIDAGPPPGNMEAADEAPRSHPLEYMGAFFFGYVTDRRANPRDDVLTELSTTKLSDGTLPDIIEVVKAAMFLFAAGQDTSAKLIGNAIRFLVENPEMQTRLRSDPSLIPAFLEETLRLEGSTKTTFRVAKRKMTIGGREIPAGQKLVIGLAAANRDPRRWENPSEFVLSRPKINQHLGLGRGVHTCIGAPLARAEVGVLLERLLALTSDIRLSERHHGKPNASNLAYEASFIIRGLDKLHVEMTPA